MCAPNACWPLSYFHDRDKSGQPEPNCILDIQLFKNKNTADKIFKTTLWLRRLCTPFGRLLKRSNMMNLFLMQEETDGVQAVKMGLYSGGL
jgi:hypothetical protein